jgi:hypothetical protein
MFGLLIQVLTWGVVLRGTSWRVYHVATTGRESRRTRAILLVAVVCLTLVASTGCFWHRRPRPTYSTQSKGVAVNQPPATIEPAQPPPSIDVIVDFESARSYELALSPSPGSEDSMRGFIHLAWKKKYVGTASINSDLLSTTRIKKSAAQEIVSVAAAQTTIGKSSLKIPFIESNAATVSKSGATKTPTI